MTARVARRIVIGGIGLICAAGIVGLAGAQPMGGPGSGRGMGPGMMGRGGMMGGFADPDAYLESLKSELAITPKQEGAWDAYAGTVKDTAEQMRGMHDAMYQSMGTLSWEERRDLMDEMFQVRQESFKTVHDAAERLLAALDDAQKAKATDMLPGLAYGPGMMGPARTGKSSP